MAAPVRIGLLGGTFDPIHRGHLLIADAAWERLQLDSVIFIPAGRPWQKAGRDISQPDHRLAMVELAVEEHPGFSVSKIEIDRPGPTYTVDTLEQMPHELGPDAELFLILGMDSLRELPGWRQPGRVFDLCTVVGVSRPGYEDVDLSYLDELADGASGKVELVRGPLVSVSGTEVRNRVSAGQSVGSCVPEPVEGYILEHGLYR
jgi:nicotinate-nucleotide adenylyltransferase